MQKTYRNLRVIRLLAVGILALLLLAACRKNTAETPEPTETLPAVAIPSLTPRPGTPGTGAETPTSPTTVPPTTDFGDLGRTEVLTTTVQSGDTVYAIALRYDLQPESIVWSNPGLMAAPWLIRPGQALNILPVDGVYHQVQPGETSAEIAAEYGVDPGVLANPWNDLQPGTEPQAGQWLVIPGGEGPPVEWEPPTP